MKKILLLIIIAAFVFSCTDPSFDFKQVSAKIEGTVTDSSGNAVAGQKITIGQKIISVESVTVNTDSTQTQTDSLAVSYKTFETFTDDNGFYSFENLFPATYTCLYEKEGFYSETKKIIAKGGKTAVYDNIGVKTDEPLIIDAEEDEVAEDNFYGQLVIKQAAAIEYKWNVEAISSWVEIIDDTNGTFLANEDGVLDSVVVTFSADRSMLMPGTSTAKFKVTVTKDELEATAIEEEFEITAKVKTSATPILFVEPAELNFDKFEVSQTLTLHNLTSSQDMLNWSIDRDEMPEWLGARNTAGSIGLSSVDIEISASRTNLDFGSFEGSFNIVSETTGQSIEIKAKIQKIDIEETSIYDVQFTEEAGDDETYPSPFENTVVMVKGIVTATGFSNGRFFISTPEGGAYNGIYIYDSTIPVALGDEISIVGLVEEYYGVTEIKNVSSYTILSSNNPIPAPVVITTNDLATNEAYEGVLVKVENVTITSETCPDQHGQWYVDDGSGPCQIDDSFFKLDENGIEIEHGMQILSITGIGNYSYSEFEINPRTPEDIVFP